MLCLIVGFLIGVFAMAVFVLAWLYRVSQRGLY